MKLIQSTAIALLLSLFASVASAHTALKTSTPADETTVKAAPSEISLVFNGPVRLVKLELMAGEKAMVTSFKPGSEAIAEFVVQTPGMLAGNYTVNWAAIGADGHTVSNSFSFSVDPAAGSAD